MASDDDTPRGRGSGDDEKRSGPDPKPSRRRRFGFGRRDSEAREDDPDEPDEPDEKVRRRVAGLTGDNRQDDRDDYRDDDRGDDRDDDRDGERDDDFDDRDDDLDDRDDFDDRDDLSDLPDPPRFRRPPWWMLLGGLILLLIVSSVLYGEFNTERYYLVCSGSKAEAHQGRGFPWPFGHQAMVGSQYRSIPLGGDAQCQTQELDSEAELQHALLKLLLVEAQRLSHKTRSGDLAKARQMINQGFGFAQNYKKERLQLEGLRATLDFQRARVVMRELETTLGEARRLFTRARRQSKQHDKEGKAWILVLDRMSILLRRRIAGDPVAPKRVGAPPAVVNPTAMSPEPARPMAPVSGSGAPDGMKPTESTEPRRVSPQAPVDAGVSGGGILL